MSKNVLLENLIKNKYKQKYEERLKIVNLSSDSENIHNDTERNNIPAIIMDNVYVWPKIKRKLNISDLYYEETINISSINDRLLIIIPKTDYTDTLCSLVEINSVNKRSDRIDLEVIGLKRFRVNKFRNIIEDENVKPIFIIIG
jgi:hypothetical protein